eukprot:CAMPEP_0170558584 /NCGR_PEP_ID=MMETSP0211-20121228/36291_1 /TAXON_ID=311385 /ORGANISM="Pseudokeronopsis sp., Strain OXSARD2" /LENGTH=51 /DNA_ID=CAMNT_0010870659 /DNA_START=422 /DNA_END=577 /DNA_ORIENTATION=-
MEGIKLKGQALYNKNSIWKDSLHSDKDAIEFDKTVHAKDSLYLHEVQAGTM